MQQSERVNDFGEALRLALKGQSLITWVALPAIIQSFDPAKCTCTAQPAIQALVNILQIVNGAQQVVPQYVNMPMLVDIPVIMMNAGPFIVSFPISAGDEALIIFADRCIDNWWNQSGVQPQVTPQGIGELRYHDLSDGFALVGPMSKLLVPGGISLTSVQLRKKDGSAYIELDASGAVNILAPSGVNIIGDLTVSGVTTGTGDGQFDGIHVAHHRHTGVQTGGGTTGEPVDG
jgi:Phage protein Gp138 N-terminal domain/GpV Apex motif